MVEQRSNHGSSGIETFSAYGNRASAVDEIKLVAVFKKRS